jgi:hypothetical protein
MIKKKREERTIKYIGEKINKYKYISLWILS